MKTFCRWVVGLAIATVLIWGVGIFFADTPGYWEYESTSGLYHPAEYTRYSRQEGRGWTQFGPFGLQNLQDTNESHRPTVLLLGDSHIEAGQIPGDQAVASCFNRMQVSSGSLDRMIAWGVSGASFSTYLSWAPFILEKQPSIEKCFILVETDDFYRQYLVWGEDGELQTEKMSFPLMAYRGMLVRLGLNSFWDFLKTMNSSVASFRIRTGPVRASLPSMSQPASREDIRRALMLLRDRMGGANKCCLVLNTLWPKLLAGNIEVRDPDEEFKLMLKEESHQLGIDVIELHGPFSRWLQEHQKFLRGFSNTPPGQGHWNEDGHRVVAEVISAYLDEQSSGSKTK